MDQPMPEGQSAPQMGPASKLIMSIHDGMTQLLELVGPNEQIPMESKQQLQAMIGGFEQLVQDAMSSSPAPSAGVSTPEAGAAKVQPAL